MNIKKMIEVCDEISFNVENDAKAFDGRPFTGRVVAEYLGNQGANVHALVRVVKEILENIESENNES